MAIGARSLPLPVPYRRASQSCHTSSRCALRFLLDVRQQSAVFDQFASEVAKRDEARLLAVRQIAQTPGGQIDLDLIAGFRDLYGLRAFDRQEAVVDRVAEEDARIAPGDDDFDSRA